MPTLQSADLWRQSGRYDAYGPEMLRIRDRHDRDMLYGPTNEEMITALFRDGAKSYRDLPRILYHIQWKFRDEVRPRFGVMRGREFLMKDAYSFDLDEAGLRHSYEAMFVAYLRTFARLGLSAVPVQAPTGPIGGDLSHEFTSSPTPARASSSTMPRSRTSRRDELLAADASTIARLTGLYAMEEEEHAKVARLPGAGRAPAQPPRHRGRPHLRLRHQIQRQHGPARPDRRRRPGPSADGQLRHRRVAAGRRDHRGEPRRRRASSGRRASRRSGSA